MGAETGAMMAIGGIARGIGSYFGADAAADAADTAKGYYRRQLGETRDVRQGFQGEESYWSRQARNRYQEMTGGGLGPEGVIPSRDIRRQAAQVGRQFAGQQVAMGILGPRSGAMDAESRVVSELMRMAKAENMNLMQLTMRSAEALRRDILGSLSIESQLTGGLAEAEMMRGAYRGQQIQGPINEITSGLESGMMMTQMPYLMAMGGQGAGQKGTMPTAPPPRQIGGPDSAWFGAGGEAALASGVPMATNMAPTTAAGAYMGGPFAGAAQWSNPAFLQMIGMGGSAGGGAAAGGGGAAALGAAAVL